MPWCPGQLLLLLLLTSWVLTVLLVAGLLQLWVQLGWVSLLCWVLRWCLQVLVVLGLFPAVQAIALCAPLDHTKPAH